ncbi:tetraspanin-1-like isoform X2 [Onychostoma macrolepis]|uniref:tetraspanin-1-like isoform X2 n=1 Tax=Onychostoma macrolepis TaxID=369639 RepID=UPI00272DAECE|nr:tetraspanin-1-like isoform X2 [Onychostoma macrolepis]
MKVKRCLKLVSTFYGLLTLAGGATAGFGIWSQINKKTSELLNTIDGTTLTMILSMGAPMLIALGCIFALMALIGFCGTLKKKSWMLLVFFVVVLIIFILQLIAAVFILLPNSVKENALSSLGDKFVESLKNYGQEDSSITTIWDETMTKLECCGYKGYDDFTNSASVKRNSKYPKPCCGKDTNSTCGKKEAKSEIVALFVSLKIYRCLRRLPDLPDPFENNL